VTFAEKLKELRAKAGLSQSALATASGMSLGAVHDYEQGKRMPTLESAVKLATALGTDCRAFAECITDSGAARVKRPRGRSQKKK
jgi:transcriptional regulator with XRE-family HTH domain